MIGRTLARYRIVDRLGRGGMGEVYRAEDTELRRDVALKVLPSAVASDPERLERFRREARAVAALNHPNIVTVHSIEEADGVRFLTMELVDGATLGSRISKNGMPLAEFFELAIPVADALAAAHERGIVHRDLKPDNVMIDGQGRVKVLDFGLAKMADEPVGQKADKTVNADAETVTAPLTEAGQVMGTIPYMSPEQVQGKPADARSDIFSLGVILYEMAAGRRPFAGETSADLMAAILRDSAETVTAVRGDLPRHLGRIVQHCLEKNPDRRYQSALDVRNQLEDLRREVTSLPAPPVSEPLAEAPHQLGKRTWWLAAALAAVLALALGSWQLRPDLEPGDRPASRAERSRPSVAVLYFDNLSGDPELDWLRHGLTDMLVTDLSQSPGLQVLATDRLYEILKSLGKLDERVTSSEWVREVAERARVETVLLGSVVKAGEMLRIHIRIQEAATGRIVASEKVDVVSEEALFSRVDDLSRGILQSFDVPDDDPRFALELAEVTTSSLAAYRHYAGGRISHYQGNFPQAITEFGRAVEIDPDFGLAWRELGVNLANIGRRREADGALRRAFELADHLTFRERLEVEGTYFYYLGIDTTEQAIEAFEREVTLYPESNKRNHLARAYSRLERHEEAIAQLEELIRQGTGFQTAWVNLMFAYSAVGEFERAEEALEGLLERDPASISAFEFLALLYGHWGKLEGAEEALAIVEARRPGSFFLVLSRFEVAVLREKWPEAEAAIEKLAELVPELGPWFRSLAPLYRGDSSSAIELLAGALPTYTGPASRQARLRNHLAGMLLARGMDTEALQHAVAAQDEGEGTRNHYAALFLTASAQMRLGRIADARRSSQALNDRAEKLGVDLEVRRYHHLAGEMALDVGDTARAVAELERAQAMLTHRGHREFQSVPDHVPIWYSLATAYLAAGKDDQAEECLRKIVDSTYERIYFPMEFVRSLYLLGEIHDRQRESEEAREHYRRFLGYWEDGDLDREWVERARLRLGELS